MKKLVYIEACFRGEQSRTKRIAKPLIEELGKFYDITTFNLNELDLEIVKKDLLIKRNKGEISDTVLSWANAIRTCDRLVIAAPFWDMSIPSALKVFIELCSIFDVTFKSDDKTCYGNCVCEKTLFITTRGMNISTRDKLDQATSYLDALSFLWGLGEVIVVSAQNMDYDSEEVNNLKIKSAIKEGLEIIKAF